jgi:hypothetical protein
MTVRHINTEAILRMQSAMKLTPRSYDDLALVSGLSKTSVTRWIKQLRAMNPKHAYIATWGEDSRGRPVIPLWAWGNKPDAERPGASPEKQAARMRAMRLRKKEATC